MKIYNSIILIVGSIMFLLGCGKMNSTHISNQNEDSAGIMDDMETDTEYNDKLGLVLCVDNVSPTGLHLIFSQSGGQSTGILKTGASYNLERYDGEKWCPVIPIINNYGWQLQSFTVNKNQNTEFKINWEWLYGQLEAGSYRIEKEISDFREPGNQDNYIYYVEFEINDE